MSVSAVLDNSKHPLQEVVETSGQWVSMCQWCQCVNVNVNVNVNVSMGVSLILVCNDTFFLSQPTVNNRVTTNSFVIF